MKKREFRPFRAERFGRGVSAPPRSSEHVVLERPAPRFIRDLCPDLAVPDFVPVNVYFTSARVLLQYALVDWSRTPVAFRVFLCAVIERFRRCRVPFYVASVSEDGLTAQFAHSNFGLDLELVEWALVSSFAARALHSLGPGVDQAVLDDGSGCFSFDGVSLPPSAAPLSLTPRGVLALHRSLVDAPEQLADL